MKIEFEDPEWIDKEKGELKDWSALKSIEFNEDMIRVSGYSDFGYGWYAEAKLTKKQLWDLFQWIDAEMGHPI